MRAIQISPWLPVWLCVLWRVLPRGWFLPLILATAVHELGHMAVIALSGGRIRALRLKLTGARLETSPLSYGQEVCSALAGPVSSLFLLLFGAVCPPLAFWGLAQGLYNLLPVYPLDGGRVMLAGLSLLLPRDRAERWYRVTATVLVVGFWIWSWRFLARLGLGFLGFLPGVVLFAQSFPDFPGKIRIFRLQNQPVNGTIRGNGKRGTTHDRFIEPASADCPETCPLYRRRV